MYFSKHFPPSILQMITLHGSLLPDDGFVSCKAKEACILSKFSSCYSLFFERDMEGKEAEIVDFSIYHKHPYSRINFVKYFASMESNKAEIKELKSFLVVKILGCSSSCFPPS